MMNLVENYIARVETSIANALEEKSKLTSVELGIDGYSSAKVRHLLNNLVCSEDRYLEIGVLHGSTFISACYENNPFAIAIDNFSQFGGTDKKFRDNCIQSKLTNYIAFNEDCFNLPPEVSNLISDMNVYFYDGDHKTEDQLKALTYYFDKLAKVFIFVVDDWNHEPARIGTRQAIEKTGVIIHKEWELRTDTNMVTNSWWNGIYIAVCEKHE